MSSRFALSLALLLTTTVLAGCVGEVNDDDQTGQPDVAADWAEHAVAAEGDHDHYDALQHQNRSTPNLQLVGWDPLVTEYHGRSSGGYLCGDVAEGAEGRVGVVQSSSDVAFVVTDLTDPANPSLLGELVLKRSAVYDVAVTPDSKYVVVGLTAPDTAADKTGLLPTVGDVFSKAVWRNGCTGTVEPVELAQGLLAGPESEAPFGSGILLADISDPTNPTIASFYPQPVLGSHSTFATQIDGDYKVMGAVTNLQHHSSYFQFFTIEETPLSAQLVLESTYRPTPPTGTEQPVINGHVDGWIAKHPGTDQTLAYLADWDGGLTILDISLPQAPQEVGRWSNFADQDDVPYDDDSGSIHSTYPLPELDEDGKHYTLIGQEILGRPDATPSGLILMMDTTDPANPTVASAWTLPVDPVWDKTLLWSTHYVQYANGTAYVAHYHAGVWVIDWTDKQNPRTAGVYVPAEVNPDHPDDLAGSYSWAPTIMDAEPIDEDTIVVWDSSSGVYVVDYDASMTMPPVPEFGIPADLLESKA